MVLHKAIAATLAQGCVFSVIGSGHRTWGVGTVTSFHR